MVKKILAVFTAIIVVWLIYAAFARQQQSALLKNLVSEQPDGSAQLVATRATGHGYTYTFNFYSDAVNVTKTSISTASTDVMYARPGTTPSSYSISFNSNEVSEACKATSTGLITVVREVALTSGTFPVCTTAKRATVLMNFTDTKGVWHRAILLNPVLNIPAAANTDIMAIFSSIKVD